MGFRTDKKVTTSHIHNDIAFFILSKLPLKSLTRFTCAKKSWSLLFQNPIFMNMFRTNVISKHDVTDDTMCLLLKQRTQRIPYRESLYVLYEDRFDDLLRLDWPPPFPKGDRHVKILGSASVNGTLCLYKGIDMYITIVLWNPCTEEFNIIPPSLQAYKNIEINLRPQGFGYDHIRDDYKVIQKVQYPLEIDGNWEMDYNDTFHEAVVEMYDPFWEIYSLRSNSWRKLNGLNIHVSLRDSSGVNLNEFYHWLGSTSNMVSFNFSNEMFSVTTLSSHSDIMQEPVNIQLGVLNECVSFVCTVAMTAYFHIWILGELNVKESWTKLFVVGPLTCVMRPIAVGIKSIIFCIKENLELAQIDLSTQTIEDIGFEAKSICKQIVIYKENFLPFGGMDN